MKTHPDKPGGNVERFQLVTKCYMSLLEKYKKKLLELKGIIKNCSIGEFKNIKKIEFYKPK